MTENCLILPFPEGHRQFHEVIVLGHKRARLRAEESSWEAVLAPRGFVYRIPNAAARELSDRVGALERDNARLTRALGEAAERSDALTKEVRQVRESAAAAEARAAHLENVERWWLAAQVLMVLLVLALGATVAVAVAALRRQRQAERFARTLAQELEEKRKTALAERQESGRRNLELENKLKELENKLGPRVVVSGRSG